MNITLLLLLTFNRYLEMYSEQEADLGLQYIQDGALYDSS